MIGKYVQTPEVSVANVNEKHVTSLQDISILS